MTRAHGLICLVGVALPATFGVGCSGRPGRISPPDIDAAVAAELAVKEYDRNSDAKVDAEELKACPALADAKSAYDSDGNGSLTQDEIAAGIGTWSKRGVGAIPLNFLLKLDGRPVDGAQVKLIPVSFLGDAVKPAIGVTDASGTGIFNMSAEDRPSNAPKNLAVMQPGLYSVEVTHPTTKIPAKFNTATTLGLEAGIAGQSPAGVTWDLKSK